ncbi:cytochrome b-c1 complex subunit 8 [Entophlyctis helioformis]|nr:cytochrome b-c1 complex subunit 8 [Entophlyctis helioformis]
MGADGWWGSMSKQVGFYEYGVSPYHLKPFKGFFNPGAFQLLKRTGRQLLFIGPPVAAYYFIASWADKEYEKARRKGGAMTGGH